MQFYSGPLKPILLCLCLGIGSYSAHAANSESLSRGLEAIQQAAENNAGATRAQNWQILWQKNSEQRELLNTLWQAKQLDTGEFLRWRERGLRIIENLLLPFPEEAFPFLQAHNASWDAITLRLRLARRLGQELKIPATALPASSTLVERIISTRIEAESSPAVAERRDAALLLCELLRGEGLHKRVPAENVQDLRRALIAGPGCIEVTRSEKSLAAGKPYLAQLHADQEIMMAFESILIAPGLNLSIKARSFDGSMVDLAAEPGDEKGLSGSLTIDVIAPEDTVAPEFLSRAHESDRTPEPPHRAGVLLYLVNGRVQAL